jgi:predicted  nucleic acid-binding Zn-ribbon protein
MDALEQLSRRVQQAADEILSLKKERTHLLSEIEALKDQLRGHKLATRETESFEREKARIRTKLEKLRTKIQKLMTTETETVVAPPSPLGELFDEKSN